MGDAGAIVIWFSFGGKKRVTSLWMNEGLAAFSQNGCNGYNDEQIYR